MALQSSKYRMPQVRRRTMPRRPRLRRCSCMASLATNSRRRWRCECRRTVDPSRCCACCTLLCGLRSAICNLQSAVCSPRSARRNFVRPWLRALHLGRCPRSSSETNYPLLFLAPTLAPQPTRPLSYPPRRRAWGWCRFVGIVDPLLPRREGLERLSVTCMACRCRLRWRPLLSSAPWAASTLVQARDTTLHILALRHPCRHSMDIPPHTCTSD